MNNKKTMWKKMMKKFYHKTEEALHADGTDLEENINLENVHKQILIHFVFLLLILSLFIFTFSPQLLLELCIVAYTLRKLLTVYV